MSDTTSISAKRILFVAYYFPPMGLSGVQRVTKMVKYLAREGWAVDVVTVRPGGYFAFDDTLLDDIDDPLIEIHPTRSLDPTRLFSSGRSVSLPAEEKRRVLSRVSQFLFQPDNKIGWIPFAVCRGRQLLKERTYSAVMASSPPYSALLAARAIADKANLPFVADFRDDWVGNPRHSYPTTLHRRVSAWLERGVLDAADLVLAINPTISRSLAERGESATPVRVMPQGFDPEDFEQYRAAERPTSAPDAESGPVVDRGPDEGRFKQSGRPFTLLYTGVFYDAQRPDSFLRALSRFLSRRPEAIAHTRAKFVGLFPEAGRKLAEELGLAELTQTTGYLDHDEVISELIRCDVAWLTIGNRPGAEGISTGKLFEYMGSRKPILALIPSGEAKNALDGYGAVRVCDPDDIPGISLAIEAFHDAWSSDNLPTGDAGHVESFDRRRQGRELSELLEALAR